MLPEKAPTIKWQDKILDTGVLKIAGMQSVHTLLKLAQLRWRTGHITRMPDGRLPKKVIYVGLPRWPEETLQRHPKRLSEGF